MWPTICLYEGQNEKKGEYGSIIRVCNKNLKPSYGTSRIKNTGNGEELKSKHTKIAIFTYDREKIKIVAEDHIYNKY